MATRPRRGFLNGFTTAALLFAAVAVAMMPLAHAAHGPGHHAHAAAGAADHNGHDHHTDHAHHEHQGADCDESDPAQLLHELMECDCLLCKAGQASAMLPDPIPEHLAATLLIRLPPSPRTAARTYHALRPPARAPPASHAS